MEGADEAGEKLGMFHFGVTASLVFPNLMSRKTLHAMAFVNAALGTRSIAWMRGVTDGDKSITVLAMLEHIVTLQGFNRIRSGYLYVSMITHK